MSLWQQHNTPDTLFASLREAGALSSDRVEAALRRVPRADFVPASGNAYEDSPQGIGYGQTISAPHMHAWALETLLPALRDGSRVLDVGSGTGILSAALAHLVGPHGTVVGIDVVEELVRSSVENIRKSNAELLDSGRLTLLVADGWRGYPNGAPFDAIHVGAAAAQMPRALVEQLAPGGRMVIPVGAQNHEQWFVLVEKAADGTVSERRLMSVRYVPLVGGQ
jgi:protein-L-isoaspartate(D-aspartate) O-methyltransferase